MPPGAAVRDTGDLSGLAARLGYAFRQPDLLRRALTHASATRGARADVTSYERLEFLGDRVLGLIVADLLFARFPEEAEGALARRLAALVRKETLAEVAAALDLGRDIVFGPGETEAGGAETPSVLSDACEAVIGAIYLDGGLKAAWDFVTAHWEPYLEVDRVPPQDAKTALQEWAQARALPLPSYREVGREGPAHEPVFTVELAVEGQKPVTAEGRSKRLAEQGAAERMLARLTGAGCSDHSGPDRPAEPGPDSDP